MNSLTKNERDGLEDAFLSIDINSNRYQEIKDLLALLLFRVCKKQLKKIIKVAKYGLIGGKFSQFLAKTA